MDYRNDEMMNTCTSILTTMQTRTSFVRQLVEAQKAMLATLKACNAKMERIACARPISNAADSAVTHEEIELKSDVKSDVKSEEIELKSDVKSEEIDMKQAERRMEQTTDTVRPKTFFETMQEQFRDNRFVKCYPTRVPYLVLIK
jgi:hypothetical protein